MRSAASPLTPSGMNAVCSDETAELGRHAEKPPNKKVVHRGGRAISMNPAGLCRRKAVGLEKGMACQATQGNSVPQAFIGHGLNAGHRHRETRHHDTLSPHFKKVKDWVVVQKPLADRGLRLKSGSKPETCPNCPGQPSSRIGRCSGVRLPSDCPARRVFLTRTLGASVTTRTSGRRWRGRPFAFGGFHRHVRICPRGRPCGSFSWLPAVCPAVQSLEPIRAA